LTLPAREREEFLRVTPVIDWNHPRVLALAGELCKGAGSLVDVARTCFEWVRDEIPHSSDHGLDPVTCSASEVLKEWTGFCYAKSHLLAALLRANGIPTGLVYQRLALDAGGEVFCLHGLNAVWLPEIGWYRVDPRGNRSDLNAGFDPPVELLPFACSVAGERIFPRIFPDPPTVVIDALRRFRRRALLEANLPDATDLD
jgi:hypothetical protein